MTGSNPAASVLLCWAAWPSSCLSLAGPHEAMWQQGPAFRRLPGDGHVAKSHGWRLGSPEQPAQVRQAILPSALKPGSKAPTWAFARGWQDWVGGGPRGKGSCGDAGAAGRALKAGDQVWAPLGQEGAHLSLDGLEMKGVCPPHPLKQDVLEGTRAPAWPCLICLPRCLIYGNCLLPPCPTACG